MSDIIERIRADISRPQVKRLSGKQWRAVESESPGVLNIIGPSFTATVITAATDLNGEDYIARNADARRIARVPEMESRILADAEALKAADALVDAIHNLADWQRYDATASHFPAEKPEVHECTDDARIALVSALTAYRKARGGE